MNGPCSLTRLLCGFSILWFNGCSLFYWIISASLTPRLCVTLLRKQELKVQLEPSILPHSLLHNHAETPPEQLQHRNIIIAACGQNPLAEELDEYSKTCPKREVGERTQTEHLASSILTKPRDGDQGRLSPHCAPSPG